MPPRDDAAGARAAGRRGERRNVHPGLHNWLEEAARRLGVLAAGPPDIRCHHVCRRRGKQ